VTAYGTTASAVSKGAVCHQRATAATVQRAAYNDCATHAVVLHVASASVHSVVAGCSEQAGGSALRLIWCGYHRRTRWDAMRFLGDSVRPLTPEGTAAIGCAINSVSGAAATRIAAFYVLRAVRRTLCIALYAARMLYAACSILRCTWQRVPHALLKRAGRPPHALCTNGLAWGFRPTDGASSTASLRPLHSRRIRCTHGGSASHSSASTP
jgi:hypothetical protein